MSLTKKENVSDDILSHLHDPDFCDVTIVASDGQVVTANKVILSMRSQYFRSMFSSNNNFAESQDNTVKMPYSKDILDRVILYLYSGQMNYDDLTLRPILDLLELLDLMNLPMELSELEDFTLTSIRNGSFPFTDCIKSLDDSFKLGLLKVGSGLLDYLGKNIVFFYQSKEVGLLSESTIITLLQKEGSETILRFNLFVTWLSVNSMDSYNKDDVLKMFNFEDFTFKELSSDVRKSGLYSTDNIMERMEQLFQSNVEDLRERDIELEAQDVELVAKDDDLYAKDVELVAKNDELEAKDEELVAKDDDLYAKDVELEEKDRQIEELKSILRRKKDRQIEELKSILRRK